MRPRPSMAEQPGGPGEEDPVVVPEPDPEADQGTGLGAHDRVHPDEPGARDRRQERLEHVRERVQAATPAAHAPRCPRADQARRAGAGRVARCHGDRRLDLIEGGVPVGAHVGGEEPVIPAATPAGDDENPA